MANRTVPIARAVGANEARTIPVPSQRAMVAASLLRGVAEASGRRHGRGTDRGA